MTTIDLQISDLHSLGIPHLDQYFGLWMVEPNHFQAVAGAIEAMDLKAHVQLRQEIAPKAELARVDTGRNADLAMIEITGTMTKYGSSMGGSGSTIRARQLIREANSDPNITGILLKLDSPGGSVAGTQELAAAVRDSEKPIVAFVEDLGASAAYYVASQASQIVANEPAMVGSIGTYTAVADFSKAAEQRGIKVHVISTGKFKGAGTPGAPVTDEQLANWQELINKSNSLFLAAVRKGRNMTAEQVADLATGQVWIASDAKSNGLIDSIGTVDQAIKQLRSLVRGAKRMSEERAATIQPQVASIQEIEQACPGADGNFVLGQIRIGATLQQAMTAHMAGQAQRIEDLCQAVEELTSERNQLQEDLEQARQSAAPGNQPLESESADHTSNGTTALAEWRAKIEETMKERDCDRAKATSIVAQKYPALQEAVLAG